MSQVATPAQQEAPKPSRAVRSRKQRRIRMIIAGIVAVAVISTVAVVGQRWAHARATTPPERIVVIAESTQEDGAVVAGLVATVRFSGGEYDVTAIDSASQRSVAGTSYDRLSDALPMGGAKLVARLSAEDAADPEQAWLLLDERAWAQVITEAGGVVIDVPEEITSFDGEQLYRFSQGEQTLDGPAAVALLLAAESFEDPDSGALVRVRLAEALASAVIAEHELVAGLLGGQAEFSGSARQFAGFFSL